MVKFYPPLNIAGLTVYTDDTDNSLFYAMPDEPSFRTDPVSGNLVLKFIEYLLPVDRPDGSKGGGFLIFDSVFVISDAKRAAVMTALNALGLKDFQGNAVVPKLAMPPFVPATVSATRTTPTATLVLLDSGGALVTKIESAGRPSLLGSLICSFTAELSPEGATIVQQAMSGAGGIVQIAYDLSYWAVLPDVTGHVWFYADKLATFAQTITKTGKSWDSDNDSENETLRESFTNSQAGGVYFDFSGLQGAGDDATKLKNDLTNWGWKELDAAAQSVLAAQSAAGSGSGGGSGSGTGSGSGSGGGSGTSSGGVTGGNTGGDIGTDHGDDGYDNVHRDEQSHSKFDFNEWYQEKDSILFSTTQQGTLPSPANFNKYKQTINANDPFFAQIHATFQVDCDFAKFLIQSVDLSVTYTKSNPNTVGGFHFTKPDDVYKFDSDTVNGDMTYQYQFNVNYQDQSAPFTSKPVTTNASVVTLDVGSMGMLYVNMTVSNVDFTKSPQVTMQFTYPGLDSMGASISRGFSFDPTKKTDSLLVVLKEAFNQKYTYQVTYSMADGSQYVAAPVTDNTQELFIKNPFVTTTVSFISEGDFVNDIDSIFLKMTYTDTTNKLTQTSEYTFTSQNRSHDWLIPTIAGTDGVVTYSGVVMHKNHTTDNIPDTTAKGTLVTFGPPNQSIITVSVDGSIVDWTKVKMAKVEFNYADAANNIALAQEILVKQTGSTPSTWTFYTKDPAKTAYAYTVTYYLAGPPPTVTTEPPVPTCTDTILVLTGPA